MLNTQQAIVGRLASADREHQKEAGRHLLLGSFKYGCGVVLAAFVLDVVFHLSVGWRLGLLLAMLAGAAGLGGLAWHTAFIRRNPLERIARFLESRDPALGSRLINLLQLEAQTNDATLTPLTRALARQAIDGYAQELQTVPLEAMARTGEWRRQLRRAAWSLLVFAAIFAAGFRVTVVEFARFADPFGDHPPYSFTRLEIAEPGPAGTNVLFGKGLVIQVKAAGHQPKDVFLTSFPPGHPEKATTIPMFDKGGAGYHQLLDNLRTELIVFARTRDPGCRSKQVHIGLVLTPQLEKAMVQVSPPAYTGLKPEEKPYAFKSVQVLEGTQVRFRFLSNRPLRNGVIEVISGDQPPQRVPMTPSADNEVSGSFIPADSGRLRFSLVDTDRLPSQGDWEGPLTVTHDLPPEVRITDPEKDAFIAADLKIEGHIEASDDYGLRSLRLHRGLNGEYPAPQMVSYSTTPVVRDSHEVVDLSPAALGAKPGDIISLFAEALDTAPQAHLARSQTVRLKVISVEDYNNFLRQQTDLADTEAKYQGLMDDLQELVQSQKQLGETARQLEAPLDKADPKQREDLTLQLDDLLAKQNELNQKLDKFAERMDHFVRENPLYDVERDLQKALHAQADKVRQSADTNNAAAREVAQRSSRPNGGRELSAGLMKDFKKASDEQVGRLGGAEESAEKEVTQTLEDMSRMQELQKDFNQFEELYRVQEELALHSQAYNHPGELSREDQLALKDLAANEKEVGELMNQLQAKLGEDAKAAEKLFPKAAKSGQDLADKIQEVRMEPLARQATGQMLAGNGERSYRLAERLRGEMEKLFAECQGGDGVPGEELDNYLKLQRGLQPGKNFSQMAKSRKFGHASGQGKSLGMGQGRGGSSGYAMTDAPSAAVLGNEQSAKHGKPTSRQSSRFGKGAGEMAARSGTSDGGKADVVRALNPLNRQSGAVASESVPEEYIDVVDNYFKALTTKKSP